MPHFFPLKNFPKYFIPTAPNHFVENIVDEIVDQILFLVSEKQTSEYPAVIVANSFINEFEPLDAVRLIDNFYANKSKQRQIQYFNEIYCGTKIQRDFIHLKPTCFLFMGIPSDNRYEVGAAFAEKMFHVHLDVHDLINTEMAKRTDVGKWIYTNLKMGKDIPVKLVLELLQKALQRPDVRYRGYVLTGFPIIPYKNFSADRLPVRFEYLINIDEPPLEKCHNWLKKITKNVVFPIDSQSKNTSPDSETSEEIFNEEDDTYRFEDVGMGDSDEDTFSSDSEESNIDPEYELRLHRIINNERLENIPSEEDVILNVRKQFISLLQLELPPDIIIYFRHDEDDNIPCTRASSRQSKSNLEENVAETNILGEADIFSIGTSFTNVLTSRTKTSKLSTFDSSESEYNSDNFFVDKRSGIHETTIPLFMKRFISIKNEMEQFILHYAKNMVIKIDTRFPVSEAVEQLEYRMKFINYKYVKEAVPIFPNGISKAIQTDLDEMNTLEEKFRYCCELNKISPNVRWRSTHFMTKCPVKLSEGKIVFGKPLFLTRFMGTLYMLSSLSAMKKFVRSPCQYFFCKPTCRVAIVGPRISAITSVLKSILNSTEYDWKMHLDPEFQYGDIYQQAKDWTDGVIEPMGAGDSLGKEGIGRRRGLSNLLEYFEKAAEKLLTLLSEDFVMEEDMVPLDVLQDIGVDMNDSQLFGMFEDLLTENRTSLPNFLRASLAFGKSGPTVYSDIYNILVEEKFNDIYKTKYAAHLAQQISKWIRTQDRDIRHQLNKKQKYSKWIISDAPVELNFWKHLHKEQTLPDVVIFLKDKPKITISDLLDRRALPFKDAHRITSYIISNFPVFFHGTECMFKSMDSQKNLQNIELTNPLQKLFTSIEIDLTSYSEKSFKTLEKYLRSKNVTIISQDLSEGSSEANNIRVLEKYFQVFKETPAVLGEDAIKRLRENSSDFEKLTVKIEKVRTKHYIDAFRLKLGHIKQHPKSVTEQEEEEFSDTENQKSINIEEISKRNIENMKERNELRYVLFGNTRKYCPVIYSNYKSLLYGRTEYAVEYEDRHYLMSSEEAFREFLSHPFKYAHICLEPVPPPFRGCLAGPYVLNRQFVTTLIAKNMKLKTASFSGLLKEYMDKNNLWRKVLYKTETEIYNEYCDDFLGNHVARYFTEGFLFEGFPTNEKQFHDMIRNHIYPEVIIILDGRPEDILQNLNLHVHRFWEDKMSWLTLFSNTHEEASEGIIDEDVRSAGLGSDFSYIYEDEGRNEAEMGANGENMSEHAFEKLKKEDVPSLQDHIEGIKAVAKLAVENKIPVIEFPFILKKREDQYKRALSFISHGSKRKNMFDIVYVLPLEMAEKMLETGICLYSHFKNFDPVDAYNLIPANMHETMRKRQKLYACLYRKLIYYLNGWDNLVTFCNNPKMYAKGDNPFQVVTPTRIAILGSPYSGITTLCNRIAQEFNMEVFTKNDLREFIRKKFPCSYLVRNSPESIPSRKMFIESIHIARNCSPNGFILDNYQMDAEDVVELAKHDVAFTLVMLVDSTFEMIWRNWKSAYMKQRPQMCVDLLKELHDLYIIFKRYSKRLQSFRTNTNDIRLFNVSILSKTGSKWEQWDEARAEIFLCLRQIGGYFKNMTVGKCFSLSHINLFWDEFRKRLSSLKLFCPVCLRQEQKLIQYQYDYIPVGLDFYDRKCQQIFNEPFGYNSEGIYERFNFPRWYMWNTEKKPLLSKNMFRENLVQHRQYFYWSCDQHRFDLIMNSKRYLPPDPNYLPLYVPFLVTNYFSIHVEYQGRCVVTFDSNRTIVSGSHEYAVYYRGKVYLCASAECALEFLKNPEHYFNYVDFVLEEPHPDWDLKDMEIDYGNLTAEVIVQALTALAEERPKHFALSIADSAAIYIGLFLKMTNPNNSSDITRLYQRVLSKYLFECSLLKSRLTKCLREGNPYIRYEDSPVEA